jgi:hypothetical protein
LPYCWQFGKWQDAFKIEQGKDHYLRTICLKLRIFNVVEIGDQLRNFSTASADACLSLKPLATISIVPRCRIASNMAFLGNPYLDGDGFQIV